MEPNETTEDDSSIIPDWLNEEYFIEILECQHREFKEIRKFSISLATRKGENFAAIIHRANIEIEIEDGKIIEKSYIIKSLPAIGFQGEVMKEFNVFPKESEMYDQIIPQFQKIFNKIGEKIEFGPRCLKINKFPFPTDIIVMEDLLKRNYKMANRLIGLDMEHMKILLKKLAKFHAASAVYYEKNGQYNNCFDEGMFSEKMRETFEKFFNLNFSVLIESIKTTWPKSFEKFAEKMAIWREGMIDKMLEITKPDKNNFNVLTHGDLWTNNFLFLYNENKIPTDVIFVDFQMCSYGSPAIDLQYLITSSANNDIKITEHNTFVAYYHSILLESLKTLGYKNKIPSLIDLHMEMLRKISYGTMTSMCILAICLLKPREDASMNTMMLENEEGHQFRYDVYNNPTYIDAMEKLLPYFDKMGALDLD